MTQYKNLLGFLTSKNFTLCVSESEFISTKKVIFKCSNNHKTTMAISSFNNKKYAVKTPSHLCTVCVKLEEKQKLFNQKREEILNSCGHKLIYFENRENVKYICGKCGSENKTFLVNLERNKGCCPKCQNIQFKNKKEDVVKRLEKYNLTLVEYKDCHNLRVICVCGKEYTATLPDIERGRLCVGCKKDRTKETNLQKYGVENPFQSEEFKEKSKMTNIERYGVDHPLKNKDILQKLKNTNKERCGYEYVFHTVEALRKARETCLRKYGAEFPLKSEFVQAKIKKTFLEKIGFEYPLLCPKIRQKFKSIMVEKYGVECYFDSEDAKQKFPEFHKKARETCFKKYGKYTYFETDEFISNYPIYWAKARETCLDKYGVEYPIQNPIIFSKCQKATFRIKEYVFPSGRIGYIRGYEPKCIDILLNEHKYKEEDIITDTCLIPVVKYKKIKKDGTERDAVYYPDIWLPDKLIEVKSTYTYEKDLENNIRKFETCVKQGFDIDVWIFDDKKLVKTICYRKDNVICFEE